MHWESVLECPGTRRDEERSANSTQRPPVAELAQWPGSEDVAFRSVQDSEMGGWSQKPRHWIALVSGWGLTRRSRLATLLAFGS